MKKAEPSADKQDRWNEYGRQRLQALQEGIEKHRIYECPLNHLAACDEILRLLTPLKGKRVLEVGCGRGDFAVWMSMQGADVTAVDIGAALLAAASRLALHNEADPKFCQADIASLPFASAAFDVVIGTAILHHLPETGVRCSIHESYRVLKDGGLAIFHEPVENSRVFDFIQNLIPVGGRGDPRYRPSILQRAAWRRHLETIDDRALSTHELVTAGEEHFQKISVIPYGFLIRIQRFTGPKYRPFLTTLDGNLFRLIPPIRKYSQTVLIQYGKQSGPELL